VRREGPEKGEAEQQTNSGMKAHNRRVEAVWRFATVVKDGCSSPAASVCYVSAPVPMVTAFRSYLDLHWKEGKLHIIGASGSSVHGVRPVQGYDQFPGTIVEFQPAVQEANTLLFKRGKVFDACLWHVSGFSGFCQHVLDHARQWLRSPYVVAASVHRP
jgi:hypothetical protein